MSTRRKILSAVILGYLLFGTYPIMAQQYKDILLESFSNPPASSRAFVRWWWNGNRVNEKEVLRELDLLQEAGFGGVEINPIKMPPITKEPEQEQLEWLSPQWIQVLKTACIGARERGMIADLLVGSGWPFGGKFLKPDQTIERMAVNYKDLKGPMDLIISVGELENDLPADYLSDSLERHSPRKLSFIRLIPTKINSVDQIINIPTNGSNSELLIRVPEGSYRLAWGVLQKGYREVVHGTPGAEGPTMDHFNPEVVQAFLSRLLEIEKELGIPLAQLIRALFADSMELAGSNWCHDFESEFLKRCGYSVDPYLPFVLYYEQDPYPFPIADKIFMDSILRVRYDYTRTLVDLFHERFTATFQKFCTDHGLLCRYQAYGIPWLIGILDGYMQVDIPESNNWFYSQGTKPDDEDYFTWSKEHGYMIWNKYASSGGHLRGKKVISCEAMTNTAGVFQASLSTIKQAGDMNFITGITHSVLHGYNYSPPEAGFPGWVRYGTYFSEHNTLWPHFKKWIDYDARVSAVLQMSDPVIDIAILPPEADNWSKHGLIRQKFHTEPWYVFELWQGISQNGSSCDYVSERILQEASAEKGLLKYGPMCYNTLILASIKSLELKTAQAIDHFVAQGGKLIIVDPAIIRTSSLKGRENDEAIQKFLAKWTLQRDHVTIVNAPDAGTDLAIWTGQLFKSAKHEPDMLIHQPNQSLYQIHHKFINRDLFFITNTNRRSDVKSELSMDLKGKSLWKWNPENGRVTRMGFDKNTVEIELNPLESCFLMVEPAPDSDNKKPDQSEPGKVGSLKIESEWNVEFHPVEGQPFTRQFKELTDFKESADPAIRNFAGKVIYKTDFELSDSTFNCLSLGEVNEGVTQIIINGTSLGSKWYGRHDYVIDSCLKLGTNEIEIIYTTLLFNYCRSLDIVEAKRWIGKRDLIANGLLGPIALKSLSFR
jgi:hypothetical protein